ncbi:MAG: PAS domain S-box protein [Enterobacterales bacterium]|nr:PAS domain S-box protein [Enterobacterales bacterium]
MLFYQNWVWNQVYGKASAYDNQNRPIRATGIWTDINLEKRIEDKLNLYSHAFQSTQDIVIILDNKLNILAVNQAYKDATGFPCRHLVGKNMLEIVSTRFTQEETQKIKQFVELNKRWNGESSVPRRYSSSFPVDVRVNIITKDSVNTGYVVVMSDISQLKKLSQ